MKSTKFFFTTFLLSLFTFSSCQESLPKKGAKIVSHGQHYQKHKDFESLNKVVELMKLEVDTSYVKSILGEPIDMGFDYRYLVDSTGVKGCALGAVFHINEAGKIDQKWVDEICE